MADAESLTIRHKYSAERVEVCLISRWSLSSVRTPTFFTATDAQGMLSSGCMLVQTGLFKQAMEQSNKPSKFSHPICCVLSPHLAVPARSYVYRSLRQTVVSDPFHGRLHPRCVHAPTQSLTLHVVKQHHRIFRRDPIRNQPTQRYADPRNVVQLAFSGCPSVPRPGHLLASSLFSDGSLRLVRP